MKNVLISEVIKIDGAGNDQASTMGFSCSYFIPNLITGNYIVLKTFIIIYIFWRLCKNDLNGVLQNISSFPFIEFMNSAISFVYQNPAIYYLYGLPINDDRIFFTLNRTFCCW